MPSPRLDGIDTSHYQSLTGAPLPALTFAMHKATEGRNYVDPTLPKFTAWYRAQKQIQHVGFYHFLRSDSTPAEQAKNYLDAINAIGGHKPGEFAVCDWERDSTGKAASTYHVTEWCRIVGAAIGEHRVAVYSAPWVDGFTLWRAKNPTVALFLANYRTSVLLPNNGWVASGQLAATVWQYSSSGSVPGIAGRCDTNMVMQPTWFAALNPPPPQKPIKVVVPKATLRLGSTGLEVRKLQQQLTWLHYYSAAIDEKFGPLTEAGVKKLQHTLHVLEDGIYGPITEAANRTYLLNLARLAPRK